MVTDRDALEWAAAIADLEQRVRQLERAPALANASIEGDAVEVYDDLGRFRAMLGNLPDGTAGMVEANGPVPGKPTPPLVTTRMGQAIIVWRTSARINYATDPSFENGASGWTASEGTTAALVGAHAQRGAYSLGVEWQPGGTVSRSLDGLGLIPGEFYTVAITADRDPAGAHIEMRVSDDTDVASTTTGARLAVTFRMGDVAPTVTLAAVNPAAGEVSWFDTWSVIAGTDASAYFDGDDDGYEWLGDRFGSASVALETVPSDVLHVQVHADTDPGFIPSQRTYQGAIIPGGGPLSVALPIGLLHFVKVVVVTASGQYSPPSDPTPVRVRPIEGVDIGAGAVDRDKIGEGAIQESHLGFTFNYGAIVVTYGPTPHADPRVDDMWWDSGRGYQPHRWDGDSWEPMQFGDAALATDSVTTRHILAGSITSGLIAAGAVSTEQLSVGAVAAGGSRLLNYQFDVPGDPDGFLHWTLAVTGGAGGWTPNPPAALQGSQSAWIDLTDPGATARLTHNQPAAVRGGEVWAITAAVRGTRALVDPTTVAVVAMTADRADTIGDVASPGTLWQTIVSASVSADVATIEGRFTIPEGAKYLTVALVATLTDQLGAAAVGFDQVVLQPVVGGVQIANGAVRAEHVAAKVIGADHLEAGSVNGEILAGQVVLGTTIITPDVDEAGNPVPYSSLTRGGYEGRDVNRKTRHRLSNTDEPSFYDGDANLDNLDVRGTASLNGNMVVARGKRVRLDARTEPPGAALDLRHEYQTRRLDTTTQRGGGVPRFPTTGGGRLSMRPFDPMKVRWMTVRPHDGKVVAVTVWSDGSRIWTFNADGSHHSWQDWYGIRLTGYAHTGEHEIAVGHEEAANRWFMWDSYHGNYFHPLTEPGEVDPCIVVPYDQTIPGGATSESGRRFHLLRSRSGVWSSRLMRLEPTTVFHGPIVTLDMAGSALGGAAVGTFDYTDGIPRFVVGERGTDRKALTFNATTGARPNLGVEAWPSAVTNRRGLVWDGTHFWDLADDGTMYRYSTNKWLTEGSVWWFAATYANAGAETDLGVRRHVNVPMRSDVRVGLPPLPTTVADPGTADRWRLYATRRSALAAAPAATSFRLQGEGIAQSVLVDHLVTNTAAPPAANTFIDADPSEVHSGAVWADGTPQWTIRGDGFQNIIEPGMIGMWPGTAASIPKGYARCNGAIVPRTGDYARAFAKHGTRWGVGDGSTTWEMPTIPNIVNGTTTVYYVMRL